MDLTIKISYELCIGYRGEKKVQARNKNNLSGSYGVDSNKVCVGCRGEKRFKLETKTT